MKLIWKKYENMVERGGEGSGGGGPGGGLLNK